MTLQEIKERIAAYESKWGKLGHTNIMKPENELQHSELNERRNTMIKTTNDFYKFRQKVAIGKEANKLAHKATISPEELNERNFQNQIDNNTLIHAGKKGEKLENAKYYAREGEPGNYRYFYTQEEYDAYKHGKQNAANVAPGVDNAGKQNATKEDYKQRSQASEDFNRENDKRWAYEISKNTKSGESNFERKILADEKGKQMDRDLGYVDKIKEDLSKGVRRVIRRDDNPVGELMDYIEDAFDDNKLRMDEKGNMTGDEKVIAKIQEMSKEAEKYGKNLADNFGTEGSKNVWDEFQKQTEDKISFLTRAYNVKDEALKAYDEGGEDAVAEYLINTDEWKDFEKEVRKLIGAGKVRINRDNSGYSKMSNEDSDIVSNLEEKIEDYVEIIGDGTGIKRSAIRKLLDKEIMNFAMARSEDKYEANSNGKDNYNSGDKKFANTNKETDEYLQAKTKKEIDNWKRRDENNAKNNGSRGKNWGYNPDNNPERNRYMKHSSIADIRAAKEESIMSEYRAFKARANKGAEKNRLSHSAVISPKELNAKYEEELAKEYIAIHPENDDFDSLSHAGQNYKYYNKIDLSNGTTRYFYTKAEWDAYQDGQGQSKKREQERTVKKNADAAAHEGDRYAKKPLPKSATMTDEERKEMYEGLAKKAKIHNQQVENYKKNEAAAKAEGERMAQKYSAMSSTVSSTNKKPSEVLEENKPKETTKNEQNDFFKKEHTDYVQKNAERINNEYNKAAEDEHNTSLQIDEKYGFNKAKTEEEVNKCWDNLVQDMYQNALTIDNPDKCYMNFFWHDENGNGSAGWDISIPEFDKWAQEYQKEIDKVFEQGYNATNLDDKKKYGDQWEAMNEELRVRTQEAKTKTLKMVTELKKKCLEQ